jgi:hypothetical protein
MSENKITVGLSVILFGILSYFLLMSDGVYGGADNYIHYRLSRYAGEHPEFFLDHWGKPLFTLLSFPFSQFGFEGTRFFNLSIGILTGFLSYRIAKGFNYANAPLALLFTVFTPMFFIMLFSSMTETLFAFVIILSVYLFLKKNYLGSAIVMSFLPFARTEGIVVLPCLFLALLYVRKYKYIPFLLTGALLYSIVGGWYYDDFLWLITKMPYGNASALYGHGNFTDFIYAYKEITGAILGVLLLLGSAYLLIQLLRKNKEGEKKPVLELLLLLAPLTLYLFFHSFLWWKGMGGSLGLTRVMAGVMPLTALLALKGWNAIIENRLFSKKAIKWGLSAVLCFLIIKTTTDFYEVPIHLNPPQQLVKEASDWLKSTEYYNNKIHYYDPFFYEMLDLNPYDTARIQELIPDRDKPEVGLAVGEIILWDAHLSPNEGQLPLKRLTENEHFQTVKVFRPEEPFTVLGGYNYEIYIFQKIK